MITPEQFQTLAEVEGDQLVSMYLPTHVAGPEIRQDHIRLKNLIASARDELGEEERADALLAPLEKLLGDHEFWRHQGRGLALFFGADRDLEMHKLGREVDEFVHVGSRFVVRPLLPSVSQGRHFHVLAISENQVRLIECTRDAADQVDLGPIPSSLVDALGSDTEEPTLQHHSTTHAGAQHKPAAAFHGHGGGKAAEEVDRERYLRAIDTGLAERFKGERTVPLVLAAVDETIGEFRKLSKHAGLVPGGIQGNADKRDARELHEAALELVAPIIDEQRNQLLARAQTARDSDAALEKFDAILEAAEQGRIETLLLRCDGLSRVGETAPEVQRDRLDLALHRALATGAKVEPIREGELDGTELCALLRY